MRVQRWSLEQALARTSSPDLRHEIGPANGVIGVLIADPPMTGPQADRVAQRVADCGALTITQGHSPHPDSPWDLIVAKPDALVDAMCAHAAAACIAAQLLRSAHPEPSAARAAESVAYAALQSGPDFGRWLAARGPRVRSDQSPRVKVVDNGDSVQITLTRGRLHNLLDRQMRDELADVFTALAADPGQRPVFWTADGRSFCGGGDPAEFGTSADPVEGHLVRTVANLAPLLAPLADRMRVRVAGPCVGAGIELAALCHSITATSSATFRLPELSMGLIPGAGGTVSIPARIGRHRTLEWLLNGITIDVDTAHSWGLIDEISQ